MGFFEILLEYIRVLIWPLIVIGILLCFKKEIRDLIPRIKRLSWKDKEIELAKPTEEDLQTIKDVQIKQIKRIDKQNRVMGFDDVINDFKNAMIEAHNASKQSNHIEAIRHLKQANQIFPNNWQVMHNLSVELLRISYGAADNEKIGYLMQAENVCKNALYLSDEFPTGTFYNLARAQAASGNIYGLKETFTLMKKIKMPDSLEIAIEKGDPDFESYKEVRELSEYQELKDHMYNQLRHE